MNWTTEKTIKQQLEKLWDKGVFFSAQIHGEEIFPLKLKLAKPTSKEITENFEQVRRWANELSSLSYLTIRWQHIRHRIQGEQQFPEEISISSLNLVLTLLHKKRTYQQFQEILTLTRHSEPQLLSWLAKYPFKALNFAEQWQKLLAILAWKKNNPVPNLYLRQVELPHIHSKFIEQHKGILSELFDWVLPPEQIQQNYNNTGQFALRYGFLDKPKLIRFRNLDSKRSIFPHILQSDLSLDSQSFSQLHPSIKRIFIVENEINYLSLPEIEESWAIFGAGYGWQALATANWLNHCEIYYWGDIDTHGFAILNQLRHHFPQVQSILMDETTLLAHPHCWTKEDKQQSASLNRLTPAENQLYTALKTQQFGENIRLEQEFITFTFVQQRLDELFINYAE